MKLKYNAFTLAEVLITLGIIGIVAAMTIPSLVNKYRDKQTVVALQKISSIMNQALTAAISENGSTAYWGVDDFVNSGDHNTGDTNTDDINNLDMERTPIAPLIKHLKVIKDCGRNAKGCFPDTYIKRVNGVNDRNIERQTRYYKVVLADGTLVALSGAEYGGTDDFGQSMEIWVDVNGKKAPNTLGKDVFMFAVQNDKFVPYAWRKNEITSGDISEICSPFVGGDEGARGYLCAAWALYKGNLDYLYCDDLNWDTKTKCK